MANYKFELNSEGVKQLLQSANMKNGLVGIAKQASNRAGDGYGYNVSMGRDRATVFVKANTHEARLDNLQNNTILRSIKG